MLHRGHQLGLWLLLGAVAGFSGCAGLAATDSAPAPATAVAESTCCNLESSSYHHLPVLSPRRVATDYRFALSTEPATPRAGAATRISLQISGRADAAAGDLGTYPERRPHFVLVSENLQEVYHLHPEDLGDWRAQALFEGRFSVPVTFAQGGRHWLAVEFLDRGQIVRTRFALDVSGPAQGPTRWDFATVRRFGEWTVRFTSLTPEAEPEARDLMNAIVHLHRNGRPVTDLEHFSGALAHVALVQAGHAGGVHHLHGGGQEHSHFRTQQVIPGYRGPKVYFNDYLGPAGRYRAVLWFKRKGRVEQVAFDFEVFPSTKTLP